MLILKNNLSKNLSQQGFEMGKYKLLKNILE